MCDARNSAGYVEVRRDDETDTGMAPEMKGRGWKFLNFDVAAGA